MYADAPGIKIVILDSLQATLDLLEKRSTNYSSRAYFTMANEVYVNWDLHLSYWTLIA
jgi:hypothetical protein